jgi:hypothetical protein
VAQKKKAQQKKTMWAPTKFQWDQVIELVIVDASSHSICLHYLVLDTICVLKGSPNCSWPMRR